LSKWVNVKDTVLKTHSTQQDFAEEQVINFSNKVAVEKEVLRKQAYMPF